MIESNKYDLKAEKNKEKKEENEREKSKKSI